MNVLHTRIRFLTLKDTMSYIIEIQPFNSKQVEFQDRSEIIRSNNHPTLLVNIATPKIQCSIIQSPQLTFSNLSLSRINKSINIHVLRISIYHY